MTPGGLVYHVLNRTVAGLPLFRKEVDYEAFERIMIEAYERHTLRDRIPGTRTDFGILGKVNRG